jgi:hypothetical protein
MRHPEQALLAQTQRYQKLAQSDPRFDWAQLLHSVLASERSPRDKAITLHRMRMQLAPRPVS